MYDRQKEISIIIPIYNEEAVLDNLYSRLCKITDPREERFIFLFVNDGSKDNSLDKLLQIRQKDNRVHIIELARNFGQQYALTAGLDDAQGDAVILMDADMEDSPEDILKFLEKWHQGYHVVYSIRKSRRTSFLKNILFSIFHKINAKLSEIPMEATGTFSLMDRAVLERMKGLREHTRYLPGLRTWVGFRQIGVELDRGARYDSSSRVSLGRLYALALDSFISFSGELLSFPFLFGIVLCSVSSLAMIVVVILKILWHSGPWGWASLICTMLILSGLQFAFIGLVGEYVSRILMEVKNRPLYIIKQKYL